MSESIGDIITRHLDPRSAVIQQEVLWLKRAGVSLCCIAASLAVIQRNNSIMLWFASIVFCAVAWAAVAVVSGQYDAGIAAAGLFIYIKAYSPICLVLNTVGLSFFWAAWRIDRCASTALLLQPSLPPSVLTTAAAATAAFIVDEEQTLAAVVGDDEEHGSIIPMANSNRGAPPAQYTTTHSGVAKELVDIARMVLATLEHHAPSSNLLEKPELLSTCSVSVPIASVLALSTAAKQVAYLGTHLDRFVSHHDSDILPPVPPTPKEDEFNIGDLTQQVVDALAGMADALDVNLALYHADNGLHYVDVLGDENAVRHVLLTLLRNVLEGCTPGACIEVGLKVAVSDDQVNVTWTVTYCPSPAIPPHLSHVARGMSDAATDRIMAYAGASLLVTPPPVHEPPNNHTRYDVHLVLTSQQSSSGRGGRGLRRAPRLTLEETPFSSDPALEDLAAFVDRLSGVRMVLHSRERSVFSKHLTSCLTSWNVDISHVPIGNGASECIVVPISVLKQQQKKKKKKPHSPPPAFILIDDDIETLEHQLKQEPQQQEHPTSIIYFTCLDNYKRMRDMLGTFTVLPLLLIVVPKPAGPRRFLTALHIAWHGAVVESQFTPIAQCTSASPQWVAPGILCKGRGEGPQPADGSSNPIRDYFSPLHIRQKQQQKQRGGVPMLPNTTLAPMTPAEAPHEGWRSITHRLTEQPHEAVADDGGRKEIAATTAAAGLTNKTPGVEEAEASDGGPKTSTRSMRRSINRRAKKPKADKDPRFADVVSLPINVLIVEDNMINQTILMTWMKKRKIQCSVASNGQEAVERWQRGDFHLVLMDIQLPVMDGITATKTIRAIEKEQKDDLPKTRCETDEFQSPVIIVALTASSLESDRHAALAAGCNDFLTKPISLEWLEKKIIEWGCMQALIDFEGWRRWKRQVTTVEQEARQEGSAASSSVSCSTTMTPCSHLQQQHRVPAPAERLNSQPLRTPQHPLPGQGVLLLGMATRRHHLVSAVDGFSTKGPPMNSLTMQPVSKSSVA